MKNIFKTIQQLRLLLKRRAPREPREEQISPKDIVNDVRERALKFAAGKGDPVAFKRIIRQENKTRITNSQGYFNEKIALQDELIRPDEVLYSDLKENFDDHVQTLLSDSSNALNREMIKAKADLHALQDQIAAASLELNMLQIKNKHDYE